MSDRGLRAQLSPNEEATLRRIAEAEDSQQQLRAADIGHLVALRLIERRDGAWQLTPSGRLRTNGPDRPLPRGLETAAP